MSARIPPHAPPRPRRVAHAEWLALVALMLAIINTARLIPVLASTRIPFVAFACAITAALLWFVVIRAFARGRNWARLVFSLVAFGTLAGVVVLALRPFPSLVLVATAIQTLLNAVAAVLLFTPSSSAWFRARVESSDPAA
jgi:hypothetical protein